MEEEWKWLPNGLANFKNHIKFYVQQIVYAQDQIIVCILFTACFEGLQPSVMLSS